MSNKKTNGTTASAASDRAALSDMLSLVAELVGNFFVISEPQRVVIALWVVHTHCIKAFDCTPYLHICSPEKSCGKSRLLELLALLVRRPLLSANASSAALARAVATEKPTLLIDEADTFINGTSERVETIRGVLNAGFARGIPYIRGRGRDIEKIDVFCPKAIAGLGELPDTVASRSIRVRMKRATATEQHSRFRKRDVEPTAARLRKQIEDFAEVSLPILRDMRPTLIDHLGDRQNDIAEPLLAIADMAGGEWPSRIRAALVELFAPETDEHQNVGTQLLADIRDIFEEERVDNIETRELVHQLCSREESSWPEYRHGRPLTANALGRLLKPYGLRTCVWWEGGRSLRGYQRSDFKDAWERYLAQPAVVSNALPRNESGMSEGADDAPEEGDQHKELEESNGADETEDSGVKG